MLFYQKTPTKDIFSNTNALEDKGWHENNLQSQRHTTEAQAFVTQSNFRETPKSILLAIFVKFSFT